MTAGSRQRAGAVVALMVVLGLLAGCSGGSEPATSSPASAPVSSTASPSASTTATTTVAAAPYKPADQNGPAQNVPKPVKPALADEFSAEGLKAFAKYWYDAYNYGTATGDTSLAEAITSGTCIYCQGQFTDIKAWYQAKNWVMGGELTPTTIYIKNFAVAPNGSYQAVVQFNLASATLLKAGGVVERTAPESTALGGIFNAAYADHRWTTSDIGKIG